VGLLCTQWAYLEWLLEIAIWWFVGLLNAPGDGRVLTGSFGIATLGRKACDLAHRKFSNQADLDKLAEVAKRVADVMDERNLAIHGVRSLQPDDTVLAAVARGKYKHEPQKLPLIRLQSLNDEVARIIAVIEPLLAENGVIEGITEIIPKILVARSRMRSPRGLLSGVPPFLIAQPGLIALSD
jgi:hypothetical protein